MRNTVYLVCNETRYDMPDFSTRVIYIDNQKRIWLFFNIIGTKLDSWQERFNNWSAFNGSTFKNKKTSAFSKEMWKNFQRSCVLFFPIPDFFHQLYTGYWSRFYKQPLYQLLFQQSRFNHCLIQSNLHWRPPLDNGHFILSRRAVHIFWFCFSYTTAVSINCLRYL